MKTIETIATVTVDGKIILQLPQLPPGILAGEHQVVVVIDEKPLGKKTQTEEKRSRLKFSAYPIGLVSESITFRREDLYAND
ncbi:MAG: hypothetical protein DSM106950_13055 [Stigonema ocellatum SAG 48.90 = DSM 106950]|nr:hypothetical protein [Stigonema ocellatum SAG 48.90 = DSM 106950]